MRTPHASVLCVTMLLVTASAVAASTPETRCSTASVPITTVYHDEVSSINPFVDTLRFFRLLWNSRRWVRHPDRGAPESPES